MSSCTLKGPCRWDLVKAPEVEVALGFRGGGAGILKRQRQRLGVPEMGGPCATGGEDGGGATGKGCGVSGSGKRQEPDLPGAPGGPDLPTPGFSPGRCIVTAAAGS